MADGGSPGAVAGGGPTGAGFAGNTAGRLDHAGRSCQSIDPDASARAAGLPLSRDGTGRAWKSDGGGDEFRQGDGIGTRGLCWLHSDSKLAFAAKAPERSRRAISTGPDSRAEFDRGVEGPRVHATATETPVQSARCGTGADRQIPE